MKNIFKSLVERVMHEKGAERQSPIALERERFLGEMRQQFLELKQKGLGITVFTL